MNFVVVEYRLCKGMVGVVFGECNLFIVWGCVKCVVVFVL